MALLSICGLFFLAGRAGLAQPISAYVILSGSMSPAIPVGSVVISRRQLSYGVGDVITFGQGKSSTTHRIDGIEESSTYYGDATFTTKGDANKTPDTAPVSQANVAGKTILTVPYLGYIVEYAKSPKGFLALIIIPATIIIYEELKNVRKEIVNALGRFFKRIKKEETGGVPKQVMIVPVIAAAFLLAGVTKAYFFDTEVTEDNFFGAAASYEEEPQIAQTLVINEFLWNSSCTPQPEQKFWLELYNGSSLQENLKAWQFKDGSDTVIQISNADHLIDPGEYILITKSGSTFSPSCYANPSGADVLNLGGSPDFTPGATGGIIKLEKPVDETFEVVDRIEYGPTLNSGALNAGTDDSIARTPNGVDSALGDTFAVSDFQVKDSPSPGVATP